MIYTFRNLIHIYILQDQFSITHSKFAVSDKLLYNYLLISPTIFNIFSDNNFRYKLRN